VSHSRVIAAAAATALFCLAVPAEAGCSKGVIMYNASWCRIAGKSGPSSPATTLDTRSSMRRPRKSKRSCSSGLATLPFRAP
jgi:hypothetical protein